MKVYKTIVKSVLIYNYSTWRLTKAQIEEPDRAHRKQLRKLRKDSFKKNRYVYRGSLEIPLNTEMKKPRWRTFGHILRLHEKPPCQVAMTDYFQIPPNSKDIREEKAILYL